MTLNQKGPCGSGILEGSPQFTPDRRGPVSRITYMVPTDQLGCFYKKILGEWECVDGEFAIVEPPLVYEKLPLPEQDRELLGDGHLFHDTDLLEADVLFYPRSISMSPGKDFATISNDATDPTEMTDWTLYRVKGPAHDGTPTVCEVPVVVEWELRRRRMNAEYWFDATNGLGFGDSSTADETRIEVGYPSWIEVEKESNVDFRSIDHRAVTFYPLTKEIDPSVDFGSVQGSADPLILTADMPTSSCLSYTLTITLDPPDDLGYTLTVKNADDGTTLSSQLVLGQSVTTLDIEFEVGSIPTQLSIEAGGFTTVVSRELSATSELCENTENQCCVTPERPQTFSPVTTDLIFVYWRDVPCYDLNLLRQLKGMLNDEAFLGYPAWAIMFVGYDIRERFDPMGRVLTDLAFQFVAKTVPADGEQDEYWADGDLGGFITSHENIGDQVGAWNRAWCKNPIKGTAQHWQHLASPDDLLFRSTLQLKDMFTFPTAEV